MIIFGRGIDKDQKRCHMQESQRLLSPVLISPEVIPGLPFVNLFSKWYVTFILQWLAFIFGRDEKEDQEVCPVQESQLLLSSLCTYLPWNWNLVQAITPILFVIFVTSHEPKAQDELLWSLRCRSICPSVRSHLWTTSPLKPLAKFH